MKVSFSHVANIIPRQTLKRTHDHETSGTVDPRFYRQQRRPARHAKRGLAHGGCQIHDFSLEKIQKLKRLAQHINESLLQSCGEYHSQMNSETNTRPQRQLELKTSVLIGNKEGLHSTLSADSLTAGTRVSGQRVAGRLACNLSVRSSLVLNSSEESTHDALLLKKFCTVFYPERLLH